MKRSLFFAYMLLLVKFSGLQALGQSTNDLQVFVDGVNTAWRQQDYASILQSVDSRLLANSNDVLALSTKMNYYVFVDNNLTNARSIADVFYSVAKLSSNSSVIAVADDMKLEIYGIPLGESGAFNQQQRDQLHAAFPAAFPMIRKCLNLAQRVQTKQ